jgi:predicted metalloprotease
VENARVRWVSSTGLALSVSVIALLAGCGDDSSGESGPPEVTVNETATVAVDPAESDATKEPADDGVEALDKFAELRRAQGEPTVPAIRGSAGLTVAEWISTVDADVANYWQKQFNSAGYRYKAPKEAIFDQRIKTGCGPAPADAGPFYCSVDGTIYLPIRFFDQQAERFGDAAVAIVIAHENGHRVQDLLGLFRAPLLSAQIELQADCLAGVWARTVYKRGLFEPGDVEEILGIVHLSGDAQGVPITAQGAHGSSGLRASAYEQGYEGGKPAACPVPKRRDITP